MAQIMKPFARPFGCVRLVDNKALEERTRAYARDGGGEYPVVKSRAGAEPSTVTVSRDAAGRWFASTVIEGKTRPLDPAAGRVGVDAGITALAERQNAW